jgi:hypothetical protein
LSTTSTTVPADPNGHFWVWNPNQGGGYLCTACGVLVGGWPDTCKAGLCASVFDAETSFTFPGFEGETTATEPERPRCISCSIELSTTLDAYYGRDAYEASQCATCRYRDRRASGA